MAFLRRARDRSSELGEISVKAKTIRCFVAMAFDRADSERIFEDHVRPMLRRNGVLPVIINRRQTNRDLNVEIVEQLRESAFCIADLTHARPSVYYEAGYAERAVPVIYTVRRDHVRPGQSDDLRVHFDLQMKPLVLWSNERDSSFSDRLEDRLRATVLSPLLKRRRVEAKAEQAKQKFCSLSIETRRNRVLKLAIRELRRQRFHSWSVARDDDLRWEYLEKADPRREGRAIVRALRDPAKLIRPGFRGRVFEAHRVRESIYTIVCVSTFSSLTKQDLKAYQRQWLHAVGCNQARYRRVKASRVKSVKEVREHHFLFSLSKVPESRVMSALSRFHRSDRERTFVREIHGSFGLAGEATDAPQTHATFYVCDDVSTESDVPRFIAGFADKLGG